MINSNQAQHPVVNSLLCLTCKRTFVREKIGQRHCRRCLGLKNKRREGHKQGCRRSWGMLHPIREHKSFYIVVHDPGEDYNKGAMLASRELPTTLAFNGLNPGTILKRDQMLYEVIKVRGTLVLGKLGEGDKQ